jgi:hypothetical protein
VVIIRAIWIKGSVRRPTGSVNSCHRFALSTNAEDSNPSAVCRGRSGPVVLHVARGAPRDLIAVQAADDVERHVDAG